MGAADGEGVGAGRHLRRHRRRRRRARRRRRRAGVPHCDFGVGFGVGANVGFGTGTDVGFGAGTGVGTSDGAHVANVGATEGCTVGTLLGGVVGTPVGMPVRVVVGLYEGPASRWGTPSAWTSARASARRPSAGASARPDARRPMSGAYSRHAVGVPRAEDVHVLPAASTARSAYLSFQAASPDLRVVHVPAAAPYFRCSWRRSSRPRRSRSCRRRRRHVQAGHGLDGVVDRRLPVRRARGVERRLLLTEGDRHRLDL